MSKTKSNASLSTILPSIEPSLLYPPGKISSKLTVKVAIYTPIATLVIEVLKKSKNPNSEFLGISTMLLSPDSKEENFIIIKLVICKTFPNSREKISPVGPNF